MTHRLDDELVAQARAGEVAAVDAVYRALAGPVRGYLASRGSQDPDGLTSEVFLVVFGRLSNLRGGASGLRTFTFSIAHARLVDELRQRARRPDIEPVADPPRFGRAPSAEDEVLARDSANRVAALLATLPAEQAEALTLRVVADLSVEQIAHIMNRSEGAVKQLQRRALLRLRESLGVTQDVPR